MSIFERIDKGEGMRAILDVLDVRYKHGHFGWQRVHCPSPAHADGDRNPSGSVNLTKGWFRCHSCGLAGDWANLSLKLRGWKVNQAAQELGLNKEGDKASAPTETLDTGSSSFLFD